MLGRRLMWKQYLEIDDYPFRLGYVPYVGDNVPRTAASAHLAREEQSTRPGGFRTLDDAGSATGKGDVWDMRWREG
jgi:hypothetical protein